MTLDTFFAQTRTELFWLALSIHPEWRAAFRVLVTEMLAESRTQLIVSEIVGATVKGQVLFLARDDQHRLVAGGILILVEKDHPRGLLQSFVVLPEFRRQGYGTAVMRCLPKALVEMPREIEVRLLNQSSDVRAFFERCGFRSALFHTETVMYRLQLWEAPLADEL